LKGAVADHGEKRLNLYYNAKTSWNGLAKGRGELEEFDQPVRHLVK